MVNRAVVSLSTCQRVGGDGVLINRPLSLVDTAIISSIKGYDRRFFSKVEETEIHQNFYFHKLIKYLDLNDEVIKFLCTYLFK